MKKSRLYFLIAVLSIIIFFCSAAICNRCSMLPAESTEETAEETAIDENVEENISDEETTTTKETTATSSTEAEEGDNSDDQEDDTDENAAPVIDKITFSAEDSGIFFDADRADPELLQNVPPLMRLEVNIEASDSNGDNLAYSVSDSLGNNFEVRKINNNKAAVNFSAPEGAGEYTIDIRVTDGKGGQADYNLDMNIVIVEVEAEAERIAVNKYPYALLSGSIVKDTAIILASDSSGVPSVFFGDTASNKQAKGYFSFDLMDLFGRTIIDASINCPRLERLGNPNFAENIDIKAFNIGPSLDYGDFAVGGVHLRTLGTNSGSIAISGDTLKNELQRIISAGSGNYFQIKIGLSSAVNANSTADGFNIYLSDMELRITYQ